MPKLTQLTKEATTLRRNEIVRLMIEGLDQIAIAAQLGTTQAQVSKDLQRYYAYWETHIFDSVHQLKMVELAKLLHIEREAWHAWHASRQPREITETEALEGGTGANGNRRKAKVRKEGQTGDAAYLHVIQGCMERRAKMLGLDVPTKIKIDFDRLTDTQLIALSEGQAPEQVLHLLPTGSGG